MVVEHTFTDEIADYLKFYLFFKDMDWENLLTLCNEYYSNLVCEFYANMLHKHDKKLPTIISSVKRVRITFSRDSIANLLGFRDEGNPMTVDTNLKMNAEDPEFAETYHGLCIRRYSG